MCKYFHEETIKNQNKNAFQRDAYLPLFTVRRSPSQRPPLLDRDPPGQRPPTRDHPWTENPPGQKNPLDRDPLNSDPPGQRPPWTETSLDRDLPGQRPTSPGPKPHPPWTETPNVDRQTPVKILPCTKLRAVITLSSLRLITISRGRNFSSYRSRFWHCRLKSCFFLFKNMSHFAYACKMRCPLNLVLEKSEYLWFY